MKSIVRNVVWSSLLLVLGLACCLSTVYAQEQGRGDQPTAPGSQAGEIPGQGRLGERGQMT
jgi:hypothetical protein